MPVYRLRYKQEAFSSSVEIQPALLFAERMRDLVAYLGFLVARILLLLQLLANGIRIDLIVNAVMAESREFTNGKVVRAAVFHVSSQHHALIFQFCIIQFQF